jgi:osmoprotectant transport system substrate-binding protein
MSTRARVVLLVAGVTVVAAVAAVVVVFVMRRSPAQAAGCAPVAGSQLVMLQDDKGLQPAENLIPMINQKAATPEVVGALDKVSAALDNGKLSQLNRAVDVDQRAPQQVAADFASAENLTAGIAKGQGGKIVIGTGDLAESQIMGELYGIALTAAGFTPEIQKVGDLTRTEPAVESGGVQVAPETAGALTTFISIKMHGANPPAQMMPTSDLTGTMHTLKAIGENYGLVVGTPSAAADQTVFAVTKAFADQHGVRTLSDLAAKCAGARTLLGGPPDCPKQPLCQPGLEKTYGLTFGQFTSLDSGGAMTKDALRTGRINLGEVRSADADLSRA